MRNSAKISPMTAYYLRKLIQSNQSMLTVLDQPCILIEENQKSFSKTVYARIQDIPYPNVLEKLVTLHKTLHTVDDKNINQIKDVESQIYRVLGFQLNDKSCLEPDEQEKRVESSLSQYREFLRKLSAKLIKNDVCFDVRVTLNYMIQFYPSPIIRWMNSQDGQGKKSQEYQAANSFDLHARWAAIFSPAWELVRQERPCGQAVESEMVNEFAEPPHARDRDWQDLCQIVRLASRISNNPTPRRSRDLVKMLNVVSVTSAELMGALRTRYYLLESRPQDEWCHMFMISDAGSTTYCGSIREIVPASRLKQFEVWMRKFWQMCEAKRDDIFLQLT